jgi:hypothetical protein
LHPQWAKDQPRSPLLIKYYRNRNPRVLPELVTPGIGRLLA